MEKKVIEKEDRLGLSSMTATPSIVESKIAARVIVCIFPVTIAWLQAALVR